MFYTLPNTRNEVVSPEMAKFTRLPPPIIHYLQLDKVDLTIDSDLVGYIWRV